MNTILKITNLTKEYENVIALKDINLEIEKGTIFGLLGPNGAGKTSLIRILTGISLPDKGSFTLAHTENKDFETLSRMIGYLPEERGLYFDMKIIDQLEFFGQIKGLSAKESREKIDYYSERIGIKDWYQKKAKELSKGMQQMVQFTATIFYEPSLIILDEPFTGLDPLNSSKMIQEIHELQKKGITIIFSTHRLEQVEEICENIALINKGQIILAGKISEIKQKFKKNIFQVETNQAVELFDFQENPVESFVPNDKNDFEILEIRENILTIKSQNAHISTNQIIKKLMEKIEIHSFVEILPSLSDIFIESVEKTVEAFVPANINVLQTAEGNSAGGQHKCVPTESPFRADSINASLQNRPCEGGQKEPIKKKWNKKKLRMIIYACLLIYLVYRMIIKHG